jgi:hypothetical protein
MKGVGRNSDLYKTLFRREAAKVEIIQQNIEEQWQANN